VSEETQAYFELTASRGAPAYELEEDLAALWKRVPQPFSALEGVETKWSSVDDDPTLIVTSQATRLFEFFPLIEHPPKLKSAEIDSTGKSLALNFERPERFPHPVRGVVSAAVGGETQFFELEVPWPTPQ
jgi:hypothetical protein